MSNGDSGSGCLALAAAIVMAPALLIYGLITGRGSGQTERPRLPYLQIGRMNAADRPFLERTRKAAERCIDELRGDKSDLSDEISKAVTNDVLQLVEKIYEMGERLTEARAFVKRNDQDRISREQADLELRQDDATSQEERASLQEAMDALAERARHAATVNQEIRTLSAQLTAATSVLETLHARLTRQTGSPEEATAGSERLLQDVRDRQRDTSRALEAYAATAREIDRFK